MEQVVYQRFQLGQLVATPGAMDKFDPVFMANCLARHVRGDWGDICDEDKSLNDQALSHGGRLMSVYKRGSDELWWITESDYSCTTALLPQEY